MFNMIKLFIIVVIFSLQCRLALSQQGFRGSAVIGFTASQLDGDNLVGYKKLGVTSGVKVAYNLAEKLSGNLEILYTQRGSSEKLFKRSDELELTELNYFELPIYLSYADWFIKEDSYFKMHGHLGFSYAALVSSKGNSELYTFDEFSKNDFSYLIGATYKFTMNWALTIRYTRALNKLLKDNALKTGYLLSYFWTIRTEYTF